MPDYRAVGGEVTVDLGIHLDPPGPMRVNLIDSQTSLLEHRWLCYDRS